MNVVACQQPELVEGFVGSESAVGIHAQLYLLFAETLADATNQAQFLIEVDGSDLQFDASEPRIHLLFHARKHLVERSHPHQSVDGNAFLAACEGGVEESVGAGMEVLQGGLQSEEHGGEGSQTVVVDHARSTELVADGAQLGAIIGNVVATELWQRCTLAHSAPSVVVGQGQEPRPPRCIHTARGARRLLEMEQALLYLNSIHNIISLDIITEGHIKLCLSFGSLGVWEFRSLDISARGSCAGLRACSPEHQRIARTNV